MEPIFSQDELSEMRQFYLTELENAERKVKHLRSVLSKLGTDVVESTLTEISETKKTVATEKKKRKRRRKRGRKSLWGNFILKLLKEKQKPLTYKEVIFSAIDRFNVPKNKHTNVKQAITNSAFRLRKINGKINTWGIPGKKEKYICLNTWFDEEGNLKNEFVERLKE